MDERKKDLMKKTEDSIDLICELIYSHQFSEARKHIKSLIKFLECADNFFLNTENYFVMVEKVKTLTENIEKLECIDSNPDKSYIG